MKFNFIISILIIIIIIYIYCYYIFPSSISILQSNINNFDLITLQQRQPIVINDCLKEKEKLIQLWFKYNLIYPIDDINYLNNWIHNSYKYLFINPNIDKEIIIYKASNNNEPPTEEEQIIAIKLKKNQSLIIPFKWKYFIDETNIELIDIYGIHDYITSFLSLF
jgi:hypothetical protein